MPRLTGTLDDGPRRRLTGTLDDQPGLADVAQPGVGRRFTGSLDLDPLHALEEVSGDGSSWTGKVERVVDGDTVIIDGKRVRINGVNMAELGTKAGAKAKEFLEQKLTGAHHVEPPEVTFAQDTTDTYGRPVGSITTDSGADIATQLREQPAPMEESWPAFGVRSIVDVGGGVASGAAALGVGGALAGTGLGVPLGFATLMGGNAATGALAREASELTDEVLYDSDRDATHTLGDVMIDGGLGLIGGESVKLARGVGGAVAGNVKRAAQRAAGTLAKEELADKTIKETYAPVFKSARDLRREWEKWVTSPDKAAPIPQGLPSKGSEEGLAFWRGLYKLGRDASGEFSTPYKYLMNTGRPELDIIGRSLLMASHSDDLIQNLGEDKFAEALKKGLKGLSRKDRRKVMELARTKGHAMATGAEPIDPLMIGLRDEQGKITDELFHVQKLVGVQQQMADGTVGELQYAKNYALSRFSPDLEEAVALAENEQSVVDFLTRQGTDAVQAKKAAATLFEARKKPKFGMAHARWRDPKTGKPIVPEQLMDQNIIELGTAMFERDAKVITNTALFGKGAVMNDAAGFMVPPGASAMIDATVASGDKRARDMVIKFFKERFHPSGGAMAKALAGLRHGGANAMLTKNWPLQLAEVSKSVSFGADGPMALLEASRLKDAMKKSGWGKRAGALTSALDELVGKEYMLKALKHKIHPGWLARTTDKTARAVGADAGLGTVQLVAKRAADEQKAIAKGLLKGHTGATLKQAYELYPTRQSAEVAVRELGDAYRLAEGTLKHRLKQEGATVLLPERLYEEGVHEFVKRIHYSTSNGMIMQIMREPGVATAMQFRAFMVQAASQYKDDVLKPIKDGILKDDLTLVHLGVSRMLRSGGYAIKTGTVGAMMRAVQSARTDQELDEIAMKGVEEGINSNMGVIGQSLISMTKAARDGNWRDFDRMTAAFPGVQFLGTALRELSSGGIGTLEGMRKVIGMSNPGPAMVAEPVVNLLKNQEKANEEAAKKRKKLFQ